MVDGLYRLKMVPLKPNKKYNSNSVDVSVSPRVSTISAFSCNRTPIDLWHFRLGHPSFERLLLLKQPYPILTSNKQFICETSHHLK